MFEIKTSGSFDKTESFLNNILKKDPFSRLDRYGQEGVDALTKATPIGDSGHTASSWTYEIVKENGTYSIIWSNTNVVDGTPVVVLLQYGHATRNGGFVEGIDFINPALRPIFERMADEAWKEVTSA